VTETHFEFDVDGNGSTATVIPSARPDREREPALGALILAHGAGSRQSHPWMVQAARAIAAQGVDVVTFDFLYSHARIALIDAVRRRDDVAHERLFIGGKSMGGRMATHVAARGAAGPLAGLVLLGYPLHPPGRPEALRTAHLAQIREPMLFVQGTRDAFGGPDELRPFVEVPPLRARILAVEGGDHSLTPPKRVAGGLAAVLSRIAEAIAAFVVNPAP
jgi:predicted alpha/beta-hydrolase family hydrolase